MIKLFIFLILNIWCSFAFSETWVINRDHSEIMFKIPYMKVSEVSGRFNDFRAEVDLKEDGHTPLSLTVQISASSIDTGNKMRDGHLRGNDFLNTDKHSYISFRSSKITAIKPNLFKASGNLIIKGISRPTSIEFSTTDTLKDTWGYDNKFVKFKSTINRRDYDIIWNKTLGGQQFLLGDMITFWGSFQIQPSKSKTPNSKHMIPDTEAIRLRDRQRWDLQNRPEEPESAFVQKLRKLINGK